MYLKRLDLLGFKSFANKTTIKFSDGVTAIVGPNGCGKTNVLDALRWVLGEQKPTMLRGGKMEEVIFNGTRDVKALGMSEVTLSIVNDRGVLPTEYNEIQITRRLFRSGESEYLMNKVPCRLKDILDLFVDTGMGAHSYSVIQQDMIESVISDKAEERRFLFEEAAGITKYKQRRKAAMRKLEATENDFLRLRDIYAEVKTRVNSLYRQHKKAERYQRVMQEIKDWELYLGSTRMRKLTDEKRQLQARLDQLSSQKTERDTGLDRLSADLESNRSELLDIERKLNAVGGEIYEMSEKAHELEREISVLAEKKTNAEQLITKNEADIVTLRERLRALGEQITEAEGDVGRQQETVQRLSAELKEAEAEQAKADRELLQARTAKEDRNRVLLELEGKLSSGRTEGQNLKEQLTELRDRIGEIDREMDHKRPRQADLVERLTARRQRFDKLTAERNEVQRRKTELTQRLEELNESSEDLTSEIADLKASIEAAEARRKLLEEMMLHYEGYESGVVAAMEDRERWPAIAGTVAEKFVPVEGMETALEAALGDVAKFLICYERSAAQEIIEHLKQERKGRVGILVPDTGQLTAPVRRPDLEMPGIVGWLETFVSTDENLHHLKDAVLARTVVVDAGADIKPILERLPYGFTAVSTDGTVYGKNVMSGGSDDRFPLFRRKEKVEEQEQIITAQQERLRQHNERKNQVTAELGRARADLQKANERLTDLAEEIDEAQAEVGELDFENRSLTAEFDRLRRERQGLSNKIEQMQARQTNLELDSTQLANQKQNLVTSISEAGSQLEGLENAASQAVERVSKLQVAEIEARSRLEQTTSRINHLKELRADLDQTLQTKSEEIVQAKQDIEHAGNRTLDLEDELKLTFQTREETTARQKELRDVQTKVQEEVSGREKQIKEIRGQREQLGEELHELQMRTNTIDSEVRSIRERLQEEYEVDPEQLTISRPDDSMTDEEAPEHLHQLKEKLKKFGAVNLLALQEYEEAAEREKFLKEQLDDLDAAKADLKSTITKINNTARELFNDTLIKVQDNFRKLFVELFNGGEADIKLVDPDDPLESDIEITARPRGKKILSITMMSGGERALTAIALLFSLYLVKPSPFCILDEIDAPLDDANCHRFLKIIRTFSKQTQFIVITHNKITMQASDNLYGVTMEQPGISKLVAVKFGGDNNGDEDAEVTIERVLEGPANTEARESGNGDSSSDDQDVPDAVKDRMKPNVSLSPEEDN